MPGALSPTSLSALIAGSGSGAGAGPGAAGVGPAFPVTAASATSTTSFVPSRPRLPLATIALIGAGESQVGNEGRLATAALDVPQILCPAWPGMGATGGVGGGFGPGSGLLAGFGGAPFRHASACALDVRMRQVSELSSSLPPAPSFSASSASSSSSATSSSSASSSSSSPAPVAHVLTATARFDLEVRGPLLPGVLPRLARIIAAMQAREREREIAALAASAAAAASSPASASAAVAGGEGGSDAAALAHAKERERERERARERARERVPNLLFTLSADAHLLTEALAGDGGDSADPLALPAAMARLLDGAGDGDDAVALAQQPKRRRSALVGAAGARTGAGGVALAPLPWASHGSVEAAVAGGMVEFQFN